MSSPGVRVPSSSAPKLERPVSSLFLPPPLLPSAGLRPPGVRHGRAPAAARPLPQPPRAASFVDYYELLQVEDTASADQIKSAYRNLAKVCHPDKSGDHGECPSHSSVSLTPKPTRAACTRVEGSDGGRPSVYRHQQQDPWTSPSPSLPPPAYLFLFSSSSTSSYAQTCA
jgi:hypothetical protein